MSNEVVRFEVVGDHVELNQLLKLAGFCSSGGEGKHLVAAGLVQVDGQVELRKTCKIRPGQRVRYADQEVEVVAAVG
ncbi:MAG TPA: RNA-binding S4 domain-containing protein [Flavobacteriales bacterium]|jgi:ribosome-associated protein|nr:RNA-binding S4 domain-containing protein [Flavobacteriales bacterium]